MGLLQKLLSALGVRESQSGRGSQRAGETTVTVEHEPDTRSEDAVKGTDGVAADTSASGSTGTITDTADEGVGATEPSEAAGVAAGEEDEEAAVGTGDESALDDAEQSKREDGDESASEATDESADAGEGAVGPGSDESPDVLNGIGPAYAERLANAGVDSVADLAGADAADLASKTDLGEGRLANWIEQAKEY